MIELYQFAPAWGLNVSPFCKKVETYCQLAGIDYKAKSAMPFKGPRGKLPFIIDKGTSIPDSEKILAYLKATYGDPLDGGLTTEQKAIGHLLRQTCEQSLYFAIVFSRWLDADIWPKVSEAFFGQMPPGVRTVLPALVRKSIKKQLFGQGYGRYPQTELYELAASDLSAISWQLARSKFAVGDSITSYDATVYALLFNVLRVPLDTPIKREALKLKPLSLYLDRVEQILKSKAAQSAG